jgi:hypothetical protein
MVCPVQRERHECDQHGIRSSVLEAQVGQWLATLEVPEDWKADLERMAAGVRRKRKKQPALDRSTVETQRQRLIDLYADVHIGREEFIGRMRALEATLTDGLPQPSYFEADLVKVKGLLHDWSMLWSKASPEERKEIVAALFGEVRVRDKTIVSATLADPTYAPLIASSEARRRRTSWASPRRRPVSTSQGCTGGRAA